MDLQGDINERSDSTAMLASNLIRLETRREVWWFKIPPPGSMNYYTWVLKTGAYGTMATSEVKENIRLARSDYYDWSVNSYTKALSPWITETDRV